MNTHTLRRLVARGLFCVAFDRYGPSFIPTFRSKHWKARALRAASRTPVANFKGMN